jgi:hypothetical protein
MKSQIALDGLDQKGGGKTCKMGIHFLKNKSINKTF